MKTKHFSQVACALAFAGLTVLPTGTFADSQRDAALNADRAAREARIKALENRMNDPRPPNPGVAKADPAETACLLAYHQAVIDQRQREGLYDNPTPKGGLQHCYHRKSPSGPKDKVPAGSIPAPPNWATQAGLLPTSPQPAPTGTGNGPTCTVHFADGTTTTVPTGSLIIPDTHTLYYVGGSSPCAVDSLVRLTPRDKLAATVGGGRYKVPAPPRPTPAVAAVANPATAAELITAFTELSGLFATWFAARAAVHKLKTNTGNVIVVTNDATTGEAPDGGTYEDYLARPVTQKALELSARKGRGRNTGQCNDDEFNKLYNEQQETACDSNGNAMRTNIPPAGSYS